MIDAQLSFPNEDIWAFCPLKEYPDGSFDIMEGLTLVSSQVPEGDACIGVFHREGQDACDEWCDKYPEFHDVLADNHGTLDGPEDAA